MKRFVILTFFFLGWAFYEMSGGSDFRPPEPPIGIAQAERSEGRTTATANADNFAAQPVTTNLRLKPVKPRVPENTALKNALRAAVEAAPTVFSDSLPDPRAGEAVRLATLEPRDIALDHSSPEPAETRRFDIRQVIGTHVNMRQGPGTAYPVIARMNLGDKVEVLSDPGNGWLRLRNMRDMQIGWISASLIAERR